MSVDEESARAWRDSMDGDQGHSTTTREIGGEGRVSQIRARLPGQVRLERIDTARALYGPLYERPEIERRIGETLPFRWGRPRTATLEPIESYDGGVIPDDALLKFDDAERTGLFSAFVVATPAYGKHRDVDPWLMGVVSGTELYAVIARWG